MSGIWGFLLFFLFFWVGETLLPGKNDLFFLFSGLSTGISPTTVFHSILSQSLNKFNQSVNYLTL